jgi:multidrug resistance efflux pump
MAADPPSTGPEEKGTRLVRVPVTCDGQLLAYATEISPGQVVPADRRYSAEWAYLLVPAGDEDRDGQLLEGAGGIRWRRLREGEIPEPGRVRVHVEKQEFRALVPGDRVRAGQIVALVEPTAAVAELRCKLIALEARESEQRAAVKSRDEAERRLQTFEDIGRRPGSISKDDYEFVKRFAAEQAERVRAKEAAVAGARQELLRAAAIVRLHECRTPVSGVIQSVEKARDNAVFALETALTVETPWTERLPEAAGEVRAVRGTRDGVLDLIGTEVKADEKVAPELVLTRGSGADARRYRRLRPGDAVEAGQVIAYLDGRLARLDAAIKEAGLRAAEAELRFAGFMRQAAESRVRTMEEAMKRVPGSVAREDYDEARQNARRRGEDEAARRAKVEICRANAEDAKKALAAGEIRSPVRGTIRQLLKVPGEAVWPGEPVLRLAVPGAP